MHLQHAAMSNAGRTWWVAVLATVLMLAVVAASAYIRARGGAEVDLARGAHRVSASAVALLVFGLTALAWRAPGLRTATVIAFVLMLALSAVGWLAGTTPPLAAAAFNQAGGLALTALLAWIAGRAAPAGAAAPPRRLALAALVLSAAQAGLGGALAVFAAPMSIMVLFFHAAAGFAVAAAVAALGARYLGCALFAPALGMTAVVLEQPAAQAAHALAAALLLAAAAYAHARTRVPV